MKIIFLILLLLLAIIGCLAGKIQKWQKIKYYKGFNIRQTGNMKVDEFSEDT